MAIECLKLAKLRLQGGLWRGIGPFGKLLAPSWTTLLFRGLTGEFLSKCKRVARALEWGDKVRYFENLAVNYSPWLSKLGFIMENPKWRKVAKKLNHKILVQMKDLWDDSKSQWLETDVLRHCHSLSLFKDVLVHKLL